MSNYSVPNDEEMLGGKFTDFFAKIDPTSSKIGGQLTKGLLAAAGTLVGIPPTITTTGLSAVGRISSGIKSATKTAQQAGAQSVAPTVTVDPNAQFINTYTGQYFSGQAPVKDYTPLIFAAGAGVIILAVVMLIKK